MMQYPLNVPTKWANWTEDVKHNDLQFYETQWLDGNAMYWWAFTVNWLALSERSIAANYFGKTTANNVFGPFKVWTESAGGGGCPNFMTGAGGYLQILWAGYAGVRLTDDALIFLNPSPPEG